MGRADQGSFSLAGLLLGMDNFMIELAMGENVELINKLLEYCTYLTIKYASE